MLYIRFNLVALVYLGFISFTTICLAQPDVNTTDGGRWLPVGAFAKSDFATNTKRNKSYAGSSREKQRIATFLPGMTIIYNLSKIPGTLLERGITHSGIPVIVPSKELSSDEFSARAEKDIVIHFAHDVCKDIMCNTDSFSVGIGESYAIVDQSNTEKIELLNTRDQKRVIYPKKRIDDLETRGYLTIHKGRLNPRLTIFEGYASHLSTSCGRSIEDKYRITVDKAEYESMPSTWESNSAAWDLKAMEIMDLGTVILDKDNGNYSGTVTVAIENDNKPEEYAIDLTVLAYRDRAWKANYFKFAGIAQVVQCSKPRIGQPKPRYVKSVDLYFDLAAGDGYDQNFPLDPIALPNVYLEEHREKMFKLLNRSFFYSINSHSEYEKIFNILTDIVPYPNAVANIIARLNATCSQPLRLRRRTTNCRKYSSAVLGE